MTAPDHNVNPARPQLYRLRNPATGRMLTLAAQPDVRYVDREGGEELEIRGRLLPLAPSPSRLPWAEEHLRICPTCDQLVQRDLNHCPYDGRVLPPLGPPAEHAERPR